MPRMSVQLKDKAFARLTDSPTLTSSVPSSRASSPAPLPPDDHFAYSTSLRRQEPDSSIIDFSSANNFPAGVAGRFTAYALPTGPLGTQQAAHGPPSHHPFAHTTTPLTPSNHYATQSVAQTLSTLATSATTGLSSNSVQAVRELSGPNEFEVGAKDPLWKQFLEHFREPLIMLLLASALVSAFVGNYDDALSIIAAVAIVVTGESALLAEGMDRADSCFPTPVGFVQERRSEKSLEALNKLVPHYCNIIRCVSVKQTGRNAGG